MLHIGHILEHTEIDVVIRSRRMLRFPFAVVAGHRSRRHRHADGGGAPNWTARAEAGKSLGEAVKLFMGYRSKQSSWSLSSEMIGEK